MFYGKTIQKMQQSLRDTYNKFEGTKWKLDGLEALIKCLHLKDSEITVNFGSMYYHDSYYTKKDFNMIQNSIRNLIRQELEEFAKIANLDVEYVQDEEIPAHWRIKEIKDRKKILTNGKKTR